VTGGFYDLSCPLTSIFSSLHWYLSISNNDDDGDDDDDNNNNTEYTNIW
jgi:hypothetical protein